MELNKKFTTKINVACLLLFLALFSFLTNIVSGKAYRKSHKTLNYKDKDFWSTLDNFGVSKPAFLPNLPNLGTQPQTVEQLGDKITEEVINADIPLFKVILNQLGILTDDNLINTCLRDNFEKFHKSKNNIFKEIENLKEGLANTEGFFQSKKPIYELISNYSQDFYSASKICKMNNSLKAKVFSFASNLFHKHAPPALKPQEITFPLAKKLNEYFKIILDLNNGGQQNNKEVGTGKKKGNKPAPIQGIQRLQIQGEVLGNIIKFIAMNTSPMKRRRIRKMRKY